MSVSKARIFIFFSALCLPSIYFMASRGAYSGDPLIDIPSQFYLGWRLWEGDRLYTDHFYMFGPLGAYAQAILYGLFGTSWGAFVAFNFLVYLVILSFVGEMLRRNFSLLTAVVGMLFVHLFFGFNQTTVPGNYNYLTPYRTELTLGFCFSLFALGAHFKQSYFLSGCLALFSFLCKAEVFFALLATIIVQEVFSFKYNRGKGTKLIFFGAGFVGCLLVFVAIFTCLWGQNPLLVTKYLFSPYLLPIFSSSHQMPFYQRVMGLTNPDLFLHFSFAILGSVLFVILPFFIFHRLDSKKKELCLLLALLAAIFFGWIFYPDLGGYLLLWQLLAPFFCLAGFVFSHRKSGSLARWNAWKIVFLFSFFCAGKVLFSGGAQHYGFVLSLPACLALFIFLFAESANIWTKRPGTQFRWRIYLLALLLPQVFMLWQVTENHINKRVVELDGLGGRIFYYRSLGEPILGLENYLRKNHSSAESLLVLPEGLYFNVALKKTSGIPFLTMLPDQFSYFGEHIALRSLRETKPALIIFYPRPLKEFGEKSFSNGYGKEIHNWVKENYVLDTSLPLHLSKKNIEVFLKP